MPCPPLIERELRVALRKKRPERRRLTTASWCAAGALLFLGFAWLVPAANLSLRLHHLLCIVGLCFVVRAPAMVAGAFAEERGNQTLGLLVLSGLSATEVFVSKALSALLIAWTDLLAMFPMLALPFLIGGVSSEVFIATILTLPILLILLLAVTLLASVLTEEEGAAVVLTAALGVALCGLAPAIHFAQTHFSQVMPSRWWLRLSPAYLPWLIWNGHVPRGEIGRNLGATLVWSGLCLVGAAMGLRRVWHEDEDAGRTAPWRQRWLQLVHGTSGRRRALAAQWLDANPFVWLAARDGQSAFMAWAVVGGVGSVWLLCWAIWGARWPSVPNLLLTVTLLNASLQWLIRHAAARVLAMARRDGAFELLLTTRLQPSDIAWGGLEALKCQFTLVGRCALAFDAALLLGGLATRRWKAPALFVYGVASGLLLWWGWAQTRGWRHSLLAMWAGLNSGRPAFSVWRTFGGSTWVWVMNLYNLRHAFSRFPTFPTGSIFEVGLAAAALLVAILAWFAHRSMARRGSTAPDQIERRLITEFREIAREPLPDRDNPGFKRWNVRERFPWGWDVVQEQLHERLARSRQG